MSALLPVAGLLALVFVGWVLYQYSNVGKRTHYSQATRSFHSKVVGVTFDNADGSSRQQIIRTHCRAGMQLELRAEPDNPRDPGAAALWTPHGQVGYIESGRLADDLLRYQDDGRLVGIHVTAITGGTKAKPTRGLNIEISLRP